MGHSRIISDLLDYGRSPISTDLGKPSPKLAGIEPKGNNGVTTSALRLGNNTTNSIVASIV